MKEVCISLESLYNELGGDLTYGTIKKSYQEETDTEYYDFYNNKHELACMDGEVVNIEVKERDYYVLLNTNGEVDTDFILSKEEFGIAHFNEENFNLACPLCDNEYMEYEEKNGTHVWICDECPAVLFEDWDTKGVDNLSAIIKKRG